MESVFDLNTEISPIKGRDGRMSKIHGACDSRDGLTPRVACPLTMARARVFFLIVDYNL